MLAPSIIAAARWPALLLAASLLAGCSMLRIAYGTAPDAVYWWLDRYVDFNVAQTPRVREAIAQWFAWNGTQLPEYAALLDRAAVEVVGDTTPTRVCAWEVDLTARGRAAFERIAPAAADVALTITPEQVQYLERRYAKFNAQYRDDYLQPDPAERAKANLKRAVTRGEELYGRLDDAQTAVLAENLARSPFDPQVWFAERRQRQQAVLDLLRRLRAENAGREQALAALRGYADQLQRSPRPDYRRYAETLDAYNCGLGARFHNATTPAQRRTAAARLTGWAEDLRAIARAKESRGRSDAP